MINCILQMTWSFVENHKESTKSLLKLINEFRTFLSSSAFGFKFKIEYFSDNKYCLYWTVSFMKPGFMSVLQTTAQLAPAHVPGASKALFTHLISDCLVWKKIESMIFFLKLHSPESNHLGIVFVSILDSFLLHVELQTSVFSLMFYHNHFLRSLQHWKHWFSWLCSTPR